MMSAHPENFIFQHSLFCDARWEEWEARLNRHLQEVDDPAELKLSKAMPELTETMSSGFKAINTVRTHFSYQTNQTVDLMS